MLSWFKFPANKLISVQPNITKLLFSFFRKYKLSTFESGEKIISPNNKEIFFLNSGVVRMFSKVNDSEVTLNIYKPYSLFPMSLILNDIQDKYQYDALFKAEGYFAPKDQFKRFLKNNPGIFFDLLKRIYLGLEGYFMRVESLLLGDAYLRVLTHLVIYTRRFGKNTNDRIVFDWSMTHYQLASQTGLARETVTKAIRKLQDKGLIGYLGKKLFISDSLKLEEEYLTYNRFTS